MAKKDLNKVMLIGRLGSDPQLRYTPNGKASANFNLATGRSWKDSDGNQKEETDWNRIVVWGRLAEVCGEWLKKGSQIYCEGRLQTRSYDVDGQKKYITEVVMNDMQMLGGKSNSDSFEEAPPVDTHESLPF